MKRLLAAFILVLLTACGETQGLDKGKAAFERGDYAAALREFRPLAEQGERLAQSRLGRMYLYGLGAQQDFDQAVKWFREAARQGDEYSSAMLSWTCVFGHEYPPIGSVENDAEPEELFFGAAQVQACQFLAEEGEASGAITLAAKFQHGLNTPKDPIKGLMWFEIGLHMASLYERTQLGWEQQRNEFASTMSPDQITEAQGMAREWWVSHLQ